MLRCYRLFDPPVRLDYYNLTRAEARAYFGWFLDEVPARLAELRSALDHNGGLDVPLDLTPGSLGLLGVWLDRHVRDRLLDANEVAEQRRLTPAWVHGCLPSRILTEETMSLCIDIGIYWGEMMRQLHPWLRWELVLKPKSDADLHQAVLVPFVTKHFNVISVTSNVGRGSIEGNSAAAELPRLFVLWDEMVLPARL